MAGGLIRGFKPLVILLYQLVNFAHAGLLCAVDRRFIFPFEQEDIHGQIDDSDLCGWRRKAS